MSHYIQVMANNESSWERVHLHFATFRLSLQQPIVNQTNTPSFCVTSSRKKQALYILPAILLQMEPQQNSKVAAQRLSELCIWLLSKAKEKLKCQIFLKAKHPVSKMTLTDCLYWGQWASSFQK